MESSESDNETRREISRPILNPPACRKCSMEEAKGDPLLLLHRRVHKQFPDGKLYFGTITEVIYDSNDPLCHLLAVYYDDDDDKEYELQEIWPCLVPLQTEIKMQGNEFGSEKLLEKNLAGPCTAASVQVNQRPVTSLSPTVLSRDEHAKKEREVEPMEVAYDVGIYTSMNHPPCYNCTKNEAEANPERLINRIVGIYVGRKHVEGSISCYYPVRRRFSITLIDSTTQEMTLKEVWRVLKPL